MRIQFLAVLVAIVVAASPTSAQRRADLVAPLALEAETAAPVQAAADARPGVFDARLIAPEPVDHDVRLKRPSQTAHVAIGAVIGTAAGVAATLSLPGCKEAGAMCAMAGFAFVPFGTLVGGMTGWVIGRPRR